MSVSEKQILRITEEENSQSILNEFATNIKSSRHQFE